MRIPGCALNSDCHLNGPRTWSPLLCLGVGIQDLAKTMHLQCWLLVLLGSLYKECPSYVGLESGWESQEWGDEYALSWIHLPTHLLLLRSHEEDI